MEPVSTAPPSWGVRCETGYRPSCPSTAGQPATLPLKRPIEHNEPNDNRIPEHLTRPGVGLQNVLSRVNIGRPTGLQFILVIEVDTFVTHNRDTDHPLLLQHAGDALAALSQLTTAAAGQANG